MHVQSISIKNIRNLADATVELSQGINIFYGQNAQGKTNLLEAIYFAGVGRSFRTSLYKEMIAFDKSDSFITAQVVSEFANDTIRVELTKDKKTISINGINIKKLNDLFGALLVVVFSPEDLNLVSGAPALRRKFVDINLCQLNALYYHTLGKYYHILNQRNALLKKIKIGKATKDTVFLWDAGLVEHGAKLIQYRTDYINNLCEIARGFHSNITGGSEVLDIAYKPNITKEKYEAKLADALERDIILGTTSVGIHKDDFSIFVNTIDARNFASQGQKRSVALSLKLSGVEYIKERGETPVLLLDDVLSELDESRQKFLLAHIQGLQTVLTCTGVEDVIAKIENQNDINLKMYNVERGNIWLR